jgi:hypothetical protein
VSIVVEHHGPNTKKPLTVWTGRQQDLFRKYASQREKAMKEIKANLQDLKEELCDDNDDETKRDEELTV